MKPISVPISLLSLSYAGAFVSIGGRRLLLTTKPAYVRTHPYQYVASQLYAEASTMAAVEQAMELSEANQLHAEATAMAAEQAMKLSEAKERAFQSFDFDVNGTIDKDELKDGLEKILNIDIPDHRVESIMAKFDLNADGVLQLEEFVTVDQFSNQLEKVITLEQSKQVKVDKQQRDEILLKVNQGHRISPTMGTKLDLSRFEKRVYTPYATPLEPMPRLSAALGGHVNLWIKRDDMLGLVGGGNKTRKLEYVMAEAIKQGADTIITSGAVQSNHCRLTLSACNKEGLNCCLVLEERVKGTYNPNASGNNYLFRLLGAEKIVTVGLGETPAAVEKMADELKALGRNVYCIPGGASNEIGAKGYVACAQEIQTQMEEMDLQAEALVCASGSGGTHAGITVGFQDSQTHVIGISTRHEKKHQTNHVHGLAEKTYRHILNDETFHLPDDAVDVYDDYVGPGYSLPTEEMEEAVTMFARLEGILLDPVYTGKAAAGLIDLVRKHHFSDGANVIFLHTGGAPSLYHYQPNVASIEETKSGDSFGEDKRGNRSNL